MISEQLEHLARGISRCNGSNPDMSASIPVLLVSTANRREHYMAKARRMAGLRSAAGLAVKAMFRGQLPTGRLAVRIVRLAPRKLRSLDRDNLESAAKPIRDGVADALGVDDADPRVCFVVDQEIHPKSEVRIEVYL